MKQKTTGRVMVIAGVIMLSFNFISYLMDRPFISLAILPLGIIFIVAGTIISNHAKGDTA